jgi:hypothetical protein
MGSRRRQGGMQVLHEKLDEFTLGIDGMVLQNNRDGE